MPTLNLQSFRLPNGNDLIVRVSTAADGTQANNGSGVAQFSADGRYVVFQSSASNLVAGDTNGFADIFRKDLVTGDVVLVSAATDGTQTNSYSGPPQISANGRYVVFESDANNLVAGDVNGRTDIFRKDLVTGEMVLVSEAADGSKGDNQSYRAQTSADGRYVVFESNATNLVPGDMNGATDIFRKDLLTGQVALVSAAAGGAQGDAGSEAAHISADGRYVVFESDASNLVAGDTNSDTDIFRRDLVTGEVVRISVAADGTQGNGGSSGGSMSGNGRYVVFESNADNLVAGDTNGSIDIFRKDLVTGEVVRVSAGANGAEANGYSYSAQISADGRYVVFESDASNLVAGDTNRSTDIFRKDLVTGEIMLLSTTLAVAQGKEQANNWSSAPVMTADSRYAIFSSYASNLVAGDSNNSEDIFRKDLVTGEVVRLSTASDGTMANSGSSGAQVSADGRYALFESWASNLVSGDTNNQPDVFRKDLVTGDVLRISVLADGTQGNGSSYGATMSIDGRYVVFESAASNLVPGDTNGRQDIFRKDLATGEVLRISTAADGSQANSYSGLGQISPDGNFVVFQSNASNLIAGDTNGQLDIFRKNLLNNTVTCVSAAADGTIGNGQSIGAQASADGRYVVFISYASNLVVGDTNNQPDMFRKDLLTGEVVRVSTDALGAQANDASQIGAGISGDGRYVVFASNASNLVAGDTNNTTDVFRKDLVTGEIVLVSTDANGVQGNGVSDGARVSADGRYVTFGSYANNLVAGDTNNSPDSFRKDLATGEIVRITTAATDARGLEQANSNSGSVQLSSDGSHVVFNSYASNLASGDTNGQNDIFMVDTALMDHPAMLDGRFAELKVGVGAASSASIAWGDGATDTVLPVAGSATFRHAYGTKGVNAAVLTVHEGDQTWAVPYAIDLVHGVSARNTALADTLSGAAGADALTGDGYANVLVGHEGNDTLNGGGDADRMEGGAGDDTYYLDNIADQAIENAGEGTDTAIVSFDANLSTLANIEIVRMADGTAANVLFGGTGGDHLVGNEGSNIIDGGAGADTMEGGAGNDAFIVDDAGDLVIEAVGGGRDTVQSFVSYALSADAEIEVLMALGSSAVRLTGNGFANILKGNAAANALHGGDGNDTIYGGAGRDVLSGGAGKDVFVFDTAFSKKKNLDKITDFRVVDDTIWLDNALFKKNKALYAATKKGTEAHPLKMNAKFFTIGEKAKDADDYFVYNKAKGILYYDADGSGAKAAVEIATLSKNLKLTVKDFFFI